MRCCWFLQVLAHPFPVPLHPWQGLHRTPVSTQGFVWDLLNGYTASQSRNEKLFSRLKRLTTGKEWGHLHPE